MRRTPRNEVKAVLQHAATCARLAGSETVEAEHLLLALASLPGTVANVVLAQVGLDVDGVSSALAIEQAASLAPVGVTALQAPGPVYLPDARRIGESTRLAMTRGAAAAKARKERRILSAHLLIGVLSADVGRVPRALAYAGIDRGRLLAEAHTALDSFLRRAS